MPDAEHLVAEAVAVAAAQDADPGLVARYWRLVPDEELAGCQVAQLVEATRSHLELARQRVPGELKLRPGTSVAGGTSLEIVTDDMPFLVDSVTSALSSRDIDLNLLVHPLVVVRRRPSGDLEEVRVGVEPEDAAPGDVVESWIRIEVDRIRAEADLERLCDDLTRVLDDVRAAVRDWPRMRTQALALADELGGAQLPVPDTDLTDAVELLRWLVDDHFTFLGYREYRLVTDGTGEELLQAVSGSGLGILRGGRPRPRVLSSMTAEAHARAMERRLLIITKANSRATVHRSAYLDYIGFKRFDANGDVVGEQRFLGLFSSAAYRTGVRDLPVVKRKVAEVVERSGLSPRSHSGKQLMEILETYPRDELFQITTDELHQAVMGVLRLAGRRQLRLFLRRDAYGRFISCLVYLPRDRFTTANRLRIQQILLAELNGIGVDYTTREDEDRAKLLFQRYAGALSDTYKNEHTPHEAVQDVAQLELLDEPGQLVMHVYRRRRAESDIRFKVLRFGTPIILSAVLPVLHSLGVRVTDERPYEVTRDDGIIYLYDFGLQLPPDARTITELRPDLENAFFAIWHGEAEVDGFNALALKAGITWREAVVLRAYAKYLRQAGTVFSQDYMETTLLQYPAIASKLVDLFTARFDLRLHLSATARSEWSKEMVAAINEALDEVTSLDQDRILRSFLHAIQATLRTSFFQRGEQGHAKSYTAFKLDPQSIPELPAPRPKFEIFVYSPRFEGVHLRFGAVARGGLRSRRPT